MRSLFAFLLVVVLAGCASPRATTISYSGKFRVDIPAPVMAGATVFSADQLSIKTESGKVLSGFTISNEVESLPADFDIRKYPRYLFRMKDIDALPADVAAKFRNSANEVDHVYDLGKVNVSRHGQGEIYALCNGGRCLGFVVKDSVAGHILSMNASGYAQKEFENILRRVLRAER